MHALPLHGKSHLYLLLPSSLRTYKYALSEFPYVPSTALVTMAILKAKYPLGFVLLFSLLLVSATIALGKQDPELQQCRHQCKHQQRYDERQQQECERQCEEYAREKRRREKEEGGSILGEEDDWWNPQRAEEKLRECQRRCESREQQQQRPQCRRRCVEEYKREQEEQGEGGRGDNPRRDPEKQYRECQKQCQRESEGQEGRQEQRRCQQRCEKQREQQERGGRGEGNMRYEGNEREEEEEEQEENNPYVFEDQHFSTKFRSEHGRERVLQKFTERSKLLRGIENYRLAICEANPQTFVAPKHCDADAILFVAKGKGTISLVSPDGRESFNLRRGDIFRVPSGATAYLVNSDNNEKLKIAKLIRPISTPGHFESFFGAGGENPESFYKAFSDELLEAAFNTRRDRLQRLFGQQKKGIVIKASEEQIRALSHEGGGGGGGGWPFAAGESSKGPFNLFKKRPTKSNNYGRLHEVDAQDYRQLEDLDVSVAFANITQGAMETPFYNTKATKIALVVEGEGYFEMACPHLSSSGSQEGQRGRGEGSQERQKSSPSYKKVSARLRPGVVFVVPPGHPNLAVASKNQNLQIVCFDINAQNNEIVALAGRKNIINQLQKEAKELAFNVPAREVDEVFKSQEEEFFFKGPREQHQGHALSTLEVPFCFASDVSLLPRTLLLASGSAVTDLCSKAEDPNFCLDAFASAAAGEADLKGLGQISLHLAISNATVTLHKLKELITFMKDGISVKARLQACVFYYTRAGQILEISDEDFKLGYYQDMKVEATFAYASAQFCEDLFHQPPSTVNPLADANRNLKLLSNIVSTVGEDTKVKECKHRCEEYYPERPRWSREKPYRWHWQRNCSLVNLKGEEEEKRGGEDYEKQHEECRELCRRQPPRQRPQCRRRCDRQYKEAQESGSESKMMLVSRRSYQTPNIPFTLVSLLTGSNFYITTVCSCQLQAYCSCRPICRWVGSSLTNPNLQSSVLKLQHGFTYCSQTFSTMAGTILVQARDPGKLCEELEHAIGEHRLSDAWKLHEQHMQMEGFPRKSVLNMILASFAESLDPRWLEKAYGLAEQAFEEHKQNLLERETLIYLSLGLAKCGFAVPSSTILRKLVEMEQYPPVSAWSLILAFMSETSSGAYLAAELVLEIGYLFQDGRVDPRKKTNEPLIAMKPNTTAFNIALAGCLLFDTTRKAEQLLDMMPRVGVKADVTLLIIMAHIYEKNGRREELKKLKRHIDEAHNLSDIQFRQFYNCLLTCHLKFGDLESASHMVLEMHRKAKKAQNSLGAATLVFEAAGGGNTKISSPCHGSGEHLDHGKSSSLDNPGLLSSLSLSFEEFRWDRKFLKLESLAKELLDTLLVKLQRQVDLLTTERGILQPTERIYVKLVKAYLEAGKTKDLAEFLIKAEKEDSSVSIDSSALVQVINTCISLKWLDQAHDLLDEMRLAGIRTGSSVYALLLKAYCKENRAAEVTALLRDVRKAGIQLDASCYETLMESRVLHEDTQGALNLFKEMKESKIPRTGHQEFDMLVKGCAESGEAGLMAKLLHEIKDGQKVDCGVHDWNHVVHFFCKKRLMQDAEKALKKMRSLGHSPNAQTFHSLVTGYAAVGGKYLEVTELWGEMKVLALHNGMKFDQELLDSVLYTFVRGGFFTRANEVVGILERGNMFVDKYKYRSLFLKYHKTLYKGKAPKFQTESQLKKRDAALTFKKWVGLY
ncbi:hypothetical protein RJ640_019725 [Escallonia rubra]|uniref:Pentatricopeptide repeat-containing protein n=1 Tax=Escallonia rubra TaxID=112253 RepID=A0AA88U7H2_9ASTE|nr:hypothetical protein RJ640_019725 [Escallonia rubra]